MVPGGRRRDQRSDRPVQGDVQAMVRVGFYSEYDGRQWRSLNRGVMGIRKVTL